MYYREDQLDGRPSSAFTSNEPRLLPPRQSGPDYEIREQRAQGKTIDANTPRLAPVKSDTPGAGTYDPNTGRKIKGGHRLLSHRTSRGCCHRGRQVRTTSCGSRSRK